MLLIDTNVIYAFLFKQDGLHDKAKELVFKQQKAMHLIPEVWQELLSIIAVRTSSETAIKVDKTLKEIVEFSFYHHKVTQQVIMDKTFIGLSPHRMSFTDCTLIHLSQYHNCDVLTFDKELAKYLNDS